MCEVISVLPRDDEEMWFFVYLLEYYAREKGRDAGDVLREWDEHGITQDIFDCYFVYHQEALTNAYEDIDSLMTTGKHIYPWAR